MKNAAQISSDLRRRVRTWWVVCCWASSVVLGADPNALYLEEIKPVLQERCFACHGALKQKGKLRLDTVASMKQAGILADGTLLERITSSDPDEVMPPEGEPLHDHEIAAIRTWIKAGAPAPEGETSEDDPAKHWAFLPVRPVEGLEGNPVDALLSARHREAGLVPQGPAPRTILLRRLHLDLTGLPPTAEQLDDERPISEIVDELLASPHYGERWGRHWMDVWRYSDWYGLGKQLRYSQKHLWRWRDWIVHSLNVDKGYDRMVQEMLAGDELAPSEPEVVSGTGFLARNYYLFNRTTWLDATIEHTGKAFLGLTFNCAKCHDHKYDPIDHEDYYRFRAIFEPHQVRLDAVPGETNFERDGLPRAFDEHMDRRTFLHHRGNPATPDTNAVITAGIPRFFEAIHDWSEPSPIDLPPFAWAPGARESFQADSLSTVRARLSAAIAERDKVRAAKAEPKPTQPPAEPTIPPLFAGKELQDDFTKAQPERWQMSGAGWKYIGGVLNQTVINRDREFLRSTAPHPADFDLTLRFRTTGGAVYKSVGFRFDVVADGKDFPHTVYASAHAPGPKVQIAHRRNGQTSYPPSGRAPFNIQLDTDYTLRVRVRGTLVNVDLNRKPLLAYHLPERHPAGNIELFAFDALASFDEIRVVALDAKESLRPAKTKASAPPVDPASALEIAEAKVAEAEAALKALQARVAADNAQFKGVGEGSAAKAVHAGRVHALAAAELKLLTAEAGKSAAARKERDQARKAVEEGSGTKYVSLRGSFKALETPEHKEPQYAATYPKTSSGRRLALANWITDSRNPLTARVAVNHIWMRHFGEPLVESVFDFGRNAPEPLHLDLLDTLAAELMSHDWSMKHLHRLILSSEAWQRHSSNRGADPHTFETDPGNRSYWRANPRRMESQVVRDSLLHLAGQLDLTLGGPSIEPTAKARRRSLYFKHSRDQKSPLLQSFDDADLLACYRRAESIVPQQALALANSETSLAASSALAKRLPDEGFESAAFRLVLGRGPDARELAACEAFTAELTALGKPARSRLVHALFNHNDFLTIR